MRPNGTGSGSKAPILVCGPGVKSEVAEKCAANLGVDWAPWGAETRAGRSDVAVPAEQPGIVVLIAEPDDDTLIAAMKSPAVACIEVGDCPANDCAPGAWLDGRVMSALGSYGLQLLVSAATAYSTNVAQHFCRALGERNGEGRAVSTAQELAVHEAVANATIHGALGVDSFSRSRASGFGDYCELLGMRLADPAYRDRRVWLSARWNGSCEVNVQDQGEGYASTDHDRILSDATAIRGLELIRRYVDSVDVSDRGRRLSMSFAW